MTVGLIAAFDLDVRLDGSAFVSLLTPIHVVVAFAAYHKHTG